MNISLLPRVCGPGATNVLTDEAPPAALHPDEAGSDLARGQAGIRRRRRPPVRLPSRRKAIVDKRLVATLKAAWRDETVFMIAEMVKEFGRSRRWDELLTIAECEERYPVGKDYLYEQLSKPIPTIDSRVRGSLTYIVRRSLEKHLLEDLPRYEPKMRKRRGSKGSVLTSTTGRSFAAPDNHR